MFETGRMAPILFHGVEPAWSARSLRGEPAGLPCAQSLATHKTDRNDARGLAHLARTGFFKPVHVKSLSAHSLRSGLVPRRYQFGEIDYVGSISKCGGRRMRALLYEAASVMLTRYKGQLKLKD
jgi:transposase